MVSHVAEPENLSLKFRSKFNHGFTNHGCVHCAVLKAFHCFKGKKPHKIRDIIFSIIYYFRLQVNLKDK